MWTVYCHMKSNKHQRILARASLLSEPPVIPNLEAILAAPNQPSARGLPSTCDDEAIAKSKLRSDIKTLERMEGAEVLLEQKKEQLRALEDFQWVEPGGLPRGPAPGQDAPSAQAAQRPSIDYRWLDRQAERLLVEYSESLGLPQEDWRQLHSIEPSDRKGFPLQCTGCRKWLTRLCHVHSHVESAGHRRKLSALLGHKVPAIPPLLFEPAREPDRLQEVQGPPMALPLSTRTPPPPPAKAAPSSANAVPPPPRGPPPHARHRQSASDASAAERDWELIGRVV